jgi:uncharacterized protein (DUF2235 family)
MKRIIVCCDGTWNKPGIEDRGQPVETNVEKIYKAIDNDNTPVKQVKYYGQGVGTSFAVTDKFLGGGTGLGIDRNIKDAYKFLMWSYEPGDEIYLFGFSRGAYTVRSLAGFIRNCGIIQPAYLNLVNEGYSLYRDRTDLTHPDSDLMKAFKKSYGIELETNIKFLGVWDTVGALGIPVRWFDWWNRRYQFHDVKLGKQIQYAYHALALDERRKAFSPALWEMTKERSHQTCEQVWFPGSHSNVGGGYADTGLSDIALKWMIDKAEDTGLIFDKNYMKKLNCNSKGELRDSLTGFFRITGQILRDINDEINEQIDKVIDNDTKPKRIRNELIHYTCLERSHLVENYRPKNLTLAVTKGISFEPVQDKWQPDLVLYLEEFSKAQAEAQKNKKNKKSKKMDDSKDSGKTEKTANSEKSQPNGQSEQIKDLKTTVTGK